MVHEIYHIIPKLKIRDTAYCACHVDPVCREDPPTGPRNLILVSFLRLLLRAVTWPRFFQKPVGSKPNLSTWIFFLCCFLSQPITKTHVFCLKLCRSKHTETVWMTSPPAWLSPSQNPAFGRGSLLVGLLSDLKRINVGKRSSSNGWLFISTNSKYWFSDLINQLIFHLLNSNKNFKSRCYVVYMQISVDEA